MQISIFTDEISRADPQRAIRLAAAWGATHVEVRTLLSDRFPRVGDEEMETFHSWVRDAGLSVSGVSPGYCKCRLDDPSIPQALAEGFPRACEWARRMDTDLISGFAVIRDDAATVPYEAPAAAVDLMGRMADVVQQHGCRLVIENEPICWGATGLEAADIVRQIGADRIGLCWDPGNAAHAGSERPYPDEYAQIKDLVRHVHMKNYDADTAGWSLLERGVVDWPGQLRALRDDGYDGFAVVETHVGKRVDDYTVPDQDLTDLETNTFRNFAFVRDVLR